ncbi:MAG: hypothetical protein JNL21_34245 [Myxococcales bacterium]|nr:hypothetical protein [Myxococcales bacterium]
MSSRRRFPKHGRSRVLVAILAASSLTAGCIHDYSLVDEQTEVGGGGSTPAPGPSPTPNSIDWPVRELCHSDGPGANLVRWVKRAGDSRTQNLRDLVVDKDGNVIVVGDFRGRISFGEDEIVSDGGFDQFIAKLDCAGNVIFARGFGSYENQELFTRLAVDGAGNIVVAGELVGTFDFGAGPMAGNASDAFVVKLAPDGSPLWQWQAGGPGRQLVRAVTVQPDGRVVVAGYFQGTLPVAGDDLDSVGAHDAFLVAFDDDGAPQQWRTFGSPLDEFVDGMACSTSGRIAITGVIQDTAAGVSFGGPTLVSNGGDDAFVAVFDASLVHSWSANFGDDGATSYQNGKRVVFSGEGLYLLTRVNGSIDFGGGELGPAWNGMGLARFDWQGHHLASAMFENIPFAHGLAVAPNGDVFVGGEFFDELALGGPVLFSYGGQDGFFARLSPTFQHRWSRGFGGSQHDQVFSLAVAPSGALYVGGNFRDSMMFDDTLLTSAGEADLLILEADP